MTITASIKSAIDTAGSIAARELTREWEAENSEQAIAYGCIRAARWLVVGFALICAASLLLGICIGLAILKAYEWGRPAFAAHCAAVKVATWGGVRQSLKQFLEQAYGKAQDLGQRWAVAEAG